MAKPGFFKPLHEQLWQQTGNVLFLRAQESPEAARIILENQVLLEMAIGPDPEEAGTRMKIIACAHLETAKLICSSPLLLRYLKEEDILTIAQTYPALPLDDALVRLREINKTQEYDIHIVRHKD